MKIKDAIEKAVEGGWKIADYFTSGWLKEELPMPAGMYGRVFLDPLFWQALGKAMWWSGHRCVVDTHPEMCGECWSSHWHLFIDHLASGGTAESWFERLQKDE